MQRLGRVAANVLCVGLSFVAPGHKKSPGLISATSFGPKPICGLCVIQKNNKLLEQFFQRVLDYIILTYTAENHTQTVENMWRRHDADARRVPLVA